MALATSDAVGAAIDNLPDAKGTGSMIGVTTFIKQNLLGGVKFCRRGGKSGVKWSKARSAHSRGLAIGRSIDNAFTRHVNGVERYSAAKPTHSRLGHVLRALSARGIIPKKAQVTLARADLKLKSTIDALAERAGSIVVIELKSTQFTKQQHLAVYDEPCIRCPTLANGIVSSERQMHLLQAAFGVIACRRYTGVAVSGIVVFSYADSATVQYVPDFLCNSVLFANNALSAPLGSRAVSKRPSYRRKQFESWPLDDSRVQRVLEKYGAADVRHAKSNVVVAFNDDADVLVAGCIREPLHKIKIADRNHLLKVLLKVDRDIFRRQQSQTYILAPHGKFWRLHRVSKLK